jgi:hypothetical protein
MSLLCAFPTLDASDFASIVPSIWTALEREALSSTRVFIEIFMIRGILVHQDSSDIHNLLARLLEYDLNVNFIISILTITMHVGVKLPHFPIQLDKVNGTAPETDFHTCVFNRLTPWFLHNNHMVRLFALFTFNRLWTYCQEDE